MANKKIIKKSMPIYKIGAWAGFVCLALIPIQIFFYIKFPPAKTVIEIYNTFDNNLFVALISLDLIYLITNIVMLVVYVPLFFIIRKTDEHLAVLGMALTFTGVAAFLASNPAFSMMNLASKYLASSDPGLMGTYLSAGEAVMAGFTGSPYVAYYFMTAVGLFLISRVMLKSNEFGSFAPIMGIVSAFLMLIPASFGTIGMVFAFLSIIPYTMWLIVVTKFLFNK